LVNDGSGEGYALLLAARQTRRAMILAILQPKPRQRFSRPLSTLRPPHARISQGHLDIFDSRTLG
jgi:hypothetical protein